MDATAQHDPKASSVLTQSKPLIRNTLTAVSLSFFLVAMLLYVFDIEQLSRTQLIALAAIIPAILSPLIHRQHSNRALVIDQMQEQLKEASRYDDVTSVLSPRAFSETAQRELLLAARHRYTVSIIQFDIDEFTKLNERFGRLMADHALQSCANLLKSSLRETDTLARGQDDSFILLMPHTELEQAVDVAKRLQAFVSGTGVHLESDKVNLSVCAGVSATQEDNYSFASLMSRSEAALIKAKEKGANQLEVIVSAPIQG